MSDLPRPPGGYGTGDAAGRAHGGAGATSGGSARSDASAGGSSGRSGASLAGAGPRVHSGRSIFVKIVGIMVILAASLMSLVGGFFLLVVRPGVDATLQQVLGEYVRDVAAAQPDEAAARSLAARLGVGIRYEGPGGAWATSGDLPGIAGARADGPGAWAGLDVRVVEASDGGAYLFAWELHRPLRNAHDRLVVLLCAVMVAVVFLAHGVLRRALQPLKLLQEGVARLGAGDLDVAVPNRTRDEFGALTAAFNEMVGRIRAMMQARDRLLLDVSHELRSPLARMSVALALLPDDDRTRRLRADVAEMGTMLGELLELERLRTGRALERRRLDLVPLVRAAAASFDGASPGVAVASAPASAFAEADAERLRTVLRNLLENAVKYSLPDSRPVEVSLAEEGGRIRLRVADDGPGIPAEDLGRLFEPFFRVDRSRSKKTGGWGLGLSMCKRILEAHGGGLAVENRAGRGACFVATIPAAADGARPPDAA